MPGKHVRMALQLIAAGALAVFVLNISRNSHHQEDSEATSNVSSNPSAAPAAPAAIASISPQTSRVPASQTSSVPQSQIRKTSPKAELDQKWQEFQTQFGTSLQAEFAADGHLISVRGNPSDASPASGNFSPSDSQSLIARAKQVLSASQELLGIEAQSPLAPPQAHPGPVSGQVELAQTLDGHAVEPMGHVSMDFGPRGELISMDSSYVHGLDASAPVRFAADELRAAALGAMTPTDPSASVVNGGDSIVWVPYPAPAAGSSKVEGVRAYRYSVKGRQIIVDSNTGKVISMRDQRQF